jgi:hypothetical protein
MAFPLGACSLCDRASRLRTDWCRKSYPANAADGKPVETQGTRA